MIVTASVSWWLANVMFWWIQSNISTAGTFPRNCEPLEELSAFPLQESGCKRSSRTLFYLPAWVVVVFSKRTLEWGLQHLTFLISQVYAAFCFIQSFLKICSHIPVCFLRAVLWYMKSQEKIRCEKKTTFWQTLSAPWKVPGIGNSRYFTWECNSIIFLFSVRQFLSLVRICSDYYTSEHSIIITVRVKFPRKSLSISFFQSRLLCSWPYMTLWYLAASQSTLSWKW